jgi:ElaB/YqjD/DUF883 family membrane-anchored ribosome-binding protein
MSSSTQETASPGLVDHAASKLDDASAMHDKAGELKEQSRSRLTEALDGRMTQTGAQAQQMAVAMRQTASEMRDHGGPGHNQITGIVESAAEHVEHLGRYLQQTSGDRLLHDAEGFARRRPWAVAGIGLMAGLAASRFLKASSEQRYGSREPRSAGRNTYSPGSGTRGGTHGSRPNGHPIGTAVA